MNKSCFIGLILLSGTLAACNTHPTPGPDIEPLGKGLYVVELVDQPHVFETGSWVDRDNWELLFLSAYLKNDQASLEKLETGRSMKGGNEDVQLFDYQQQAGRYAPK